MDRLRCDVTVPTADEERAMFATMHDAAAAPGARSLARHDLIVRNMPLARRLLAGYRPRGVGRDDVAGWGWLALVETVDRFRPELGFRLSTFLTHSLRRVVRAYVREHEYPIRVPHNVLNEPHRYHPLTVAAAAAARGCVRYEGSRPLDHGGGDYRRPGGDPGEGEAARRHAAELTDDLLAAVGDRDTDLIARRFGLRGGAGEVLREIAAGQGVSRQAVNKRFTKAMARLRAAAADLKPITRSPRETA